MQQYYKYIAHDILIPMLFLCVKFGIFVLCIYSSSVFPLNCSLFLPNVQRCDNLQYIYTCIHVMKSWSGQYSVRIMAFIIVMIVNAYVAAVEWLHRYGPQLLQGSDLYFQTVEIKSSNQICEAIMVCVMCKHYTSLGMSLAPACSRSFTTSKWPFQLETRRAVLPFCVERIKVESNHSDTVIHHLLFLCSLHQLWPLAASW